MDWAASWSDGVDRFDRYSKTLYCACMQLVTYSEWRVGSTAQKTPIFNVTSTLVFLTVRLSVGDIFSQEFAPHIRILYKKNYRNWISGYWDNYIVLFLWTDRYSVPQCRDNSEPHSLVIPAFFLQRCHDFPPFQRDAKLTLNQWGMSLASKNNPTPVGEEREIWG